MPQPLAAGLALIVAAGLMAGDCMLPAKFARRWRWENTWLVFSVVSLVVLPWGLALALVDHLGAVYAMVTPGQFAVPLLFGAGWGVAQVLFGLSVQRLGLGLAYAIIIGLGTLLGTLVPLFVQHRAVVSRPVLTDVLAGIAVMLVGIALSAWAGQMRERRSGAAESADNYTAAVVLAVLCGLLAPMLNYSFAFGQQIAEAAVTLGNPAVRAAYAVWPVGLAGGLVPNLAYCLYLLRKNRSAGLFCSASGDAVWGMLMAVLWMGAFAFYGMSASYLGTFGTSIGWGLFQIFMIMTATLSGVLTGEWKGSPKRASGVLALGMICLISATALLAMANR